MIITTENSVYTLQDKGDGAWVLTSTNPRYAGPMLVSMDVEPEVGFRCMIQRLDGPKRGIPFVTSRVMEVSYDVPN